MGIFALQEVRWPFNGFVNSVNYIIFYSSRDNGIDQAEVGFTINNKHKNAVLKFRTVNEKWCYFRLRKSTCLLTKGTETVLVKCVRSCGSGHFLALVRVVHRGCKYSL